jgi:hypothetical protein
MAGQGDAFPFCIGTQPRAAVPHESGNVLQRSRGGCGPQYSLRDTVVLSTEAVRRGSATSLRPGSFFESVKIGVISVIPGEVWAELETQRSLQLVPALICPFTRKSDARMGALTNAR